MTKEIKDSDPNKNMFRSPPSASSLPTSISGENPQSIGFIRQKELEKLGKDSKGAMGSFGEVFSGRWTDKIGKRHLTALKKPRPETEEEFDKEIKTLSKVNHLFVVKYHGLVDMIDDAGKTKSSLIAMELCEGDLKTYVIEGLPEIAKGSLNNRVILGQVVLGLTYIHGLGIIHKDLKLQNILLWKSPSGLVLAKLADFGYSKGLKEGQIEHSDTTRFGTWGYMAPELLAAANSEPQQPTKCSYATDAYALGIVISYTAKGEHPYGENPYMRNLLMSKGRAPTKLDADWDLTDLVARLTYKDPKKRPRVDTVIYHPYFVLSNNKSKSNYIEKVYHFLESFADWTYSTDDIGSADDNKLKLGWYLGNFCHISIGSHLGPIRERSNTSVSLTNEDFEAFTENLILSPSSSLEDLTNQLEEVASLKPLFDFDEKNREHLLLLQDETNIMEKIKQTNDFTRIHIFSLMKSGMLNFYVWCLMYNLTPQVLTMLASTNDHFKRCFEMTEFEFASVHFDGEETIKEIWDLKYEHENSEDEPQPLFAFTASSLFPTFMWKTLIRRFEDHINSTKNGIKGRPLLNWVAFNEQPFDSTNESPEHFIRLILKKGGDANGTDIFGLTPVHMAARNNGSHACIILKVLLEEGEGDPNFPNQRAKDPALEMILPIVNLEKLKNSLIEKIKTGLASAQQPANSESTTTFAERTQDPLASFFDGEGNLLPQFQPMIQKLKVPLLLHFKVLEGLAFILMSLLTENSGNPVVKNLEGRTPVHCAAANEIPNGPELLELLLYHKGNPNLEDHVGWTALHCVAANKYDTAPKMMEILLQGGGIPTKVNKDGKTPLDIAGTNKSKYGPQLVELLKNWRPNEKDIA